MRFISRLPWPIQDKYYWVQNALFSRYDRITLDGMSAGDYHDTDYRMFHVVFQLLCDFVEIELAQMEMICHRKEYSWWQRMTQYHLPMWWPGKRKFARELGLRHFEWSCNLKEPDFDKWDNEKHEYTETEALSNQAVHAIKLRDLYLWYRDVLPNRPDPWDMALPDYNEAMIVQDKDETGNHPLVFDRSPKGEAYYASLQVCADEEQRLYEEDTAKAQEVLAIRQGMWT